MFKISGYLVKNQAIFGDVWSFGLCLLTDTSGESGPIEEIGRWAF